MNKLKLGFADIHKDIAKFFYYALKTRYDIEIDNDNPDFLLFCDENFGQSNLRFSKKDCIKVFYTGENRRPENYDCHYAITFDHNYSPWHYRLPLFMVYAWTMKYLHSMPYDIAEILHCKQKPKTGCCSCVVSNPHGTVRNEFFNKLNAIKQIDSAGKHLKNIDVDLSTHAAKMDFISSRKFNICFENSSYPGYMSEKLMHAFYAGTVPVYWGSPTAAVDFNSKAFINVHDYPSLDHAIEKIIQLDNSPELYQATLDEPKFTCNIPPSYFFMDNFLNWFDAIVYKKVLAK